MLLNVFADWVSLIETRWILEKAQRCSNWVVAVLLVVDLVLSGLIFMAIPLILGDASDFFDAARFQGDRPWFGILFWTTFSTSVLFFSFVVTVPFLRVSHLLVRSLRSFVDFSAQPVLGFFAAMALAITLGFVVAAIAILIVRGP